MKGLLITLLVLGSVSSIGCSKKKKPSQQAMINACLFDPTGNCPRQAAAMAAAGGAGLPPGVLPYNITQGGQNPFILGGGAPGTTGTVRVASKISDRDVRAQAARVRDGIRADSLNPQSLHYDPPTNTVPQQGSIDRSVLTQNDQVGLQNRGPASTAPAGGEEEGVR